MGLEGPPSMAASEQDGDQLHLTKASPQGCVAQGLGRAHHTARPKSGMTRTSPGQHKSYVRSGRRP